MDQKTTERQELIRTHMKLMGKAISYVGSQKQLAEKMGEPATPDLVSKWANGHMTVTSRYAALVHDATDGFVQYSEFHPEILQFYQLTPMQKRLAKRASLDYSKRKSKGLKKAG